MPAQTDLMGSQIPTAVTDAAMRKMRGLFASGVTAVTTALEGRLHGVTVSAFTAVSLDPPLVSDRAGDRGYLVRDDRRKRHFRRQHLERGTRVLSERFAARAPLVNEAFDGVPHHLEATGAPILEGALAWYDCRVTQAIQGGDHTIFIGRVEAVGFGTRDRRPLIYFANRYSHLRA